MDRTQLQLREDSRSTPGFYGPWSFKILKSWLLIRSKMANFWLLLKLWQSKSSFPSISKDFLAQSYIHANYLLKNPSLKFFFASASLLYFPKLNSYDETKKMNCTLERREGTIKNWNQLWQQYNAAYFLSHLKKKTCWKEET